MVGTTIQMSAIQMVSKINLAEKLAEKSNAIREGEQICRGACEQIVWQEAICSCPMQ